MTEQSPTHDNDRFAAVAWERRPNGGRMFIPGKRHLYDATIDLAETGSLRTLCGTEVPREVLRQMRAGRLGGINVAAIVMDAQDTAAVDPCGRCAGVAGKATGARS